MSITRLPSRAKLPALPSIRVRPAEPITLDPITEPERDTVDEYGLGMWAELVAPRGRYYIAIAYKDLGADGMVPPVQNFGPGMLTVPELVVYGWLIDHDYEPQEWSSRSFTYQVQELGGREAGGAVIDFRVMRDRRVIGILVHSIYHSLSSPYGGGVAVQANTKQIERLRGSGRYDVVMEVNGNGELEHGGDAAIDIDLARINYA